MIKKMHQAIMLPVFMITIGCFASNPLPHEDPYEIIFQRESNLKAAKRAHKNSKNSHKRLFSKGRSLRGNNKAKARGRFKHNIKAETNDAWQ
jgi:hypothetical protein